MYNHRTSLSLSKLTRNASKGFKKAVISTTALTTILFGVGAEVFAESSLKTVYYIYVNDSYVGTVSNKEIISKLVEEKIKTTETSVDKNLNLETNLTYIPEQVFESVSNKEDEKVIEQLENLLSVEAEATQLVIDEKVAVTVKDRSAAEQVIEALKLKYVSQDQLEQIKIQQEDPTKSLPPLKENETRLIDVRLSKNVSFSEGKVNPDKILTVDEAVEYLLKGTLEEKKYKVTEGDVLGKIANGHNMTLEQLLTLNPGLKEDSLLKIGQELNVTILQPLVEVIIDKEVFKKEAVPFNREVEENSTMYKGDTKIKQEGKEGLKEVTYKISEGNGVVLNKETISETIIEEPVSEITIKGTKVIPSRGDGSFAWPAVGGYISSRQGQRWGKLHKGIDIARPSNRAIKAADNGKIVFAGWSGGYGNKVVIDHQNGYETIYAHLSSISVSVGQSVEKGSQIGVMGSTGNSTGLHLHFEIYKNGELKNPLDYIR